MRCNKCGQEFGKGDTCQHCGADKVSALGEFSGYSTPNNKQTTVKNSISSPASQHIEPITSQICWKCGEIIPLGKFCPVCGQDLFQVCPKCQTQYSSQYHICPNCGTNHIEFETELKRKKEHEKEVAYEQSLNSLLSNYRQQAKHAKNVCDQVWVRQEQKDTLLPLLKTLDKELDKVSYVTASYELHGVEKALNKLLSEPLFRQIQEQYDRKEEENRIKKKVEAEEAKAKENTVNVIWAIICIVGLLSVIFGWWH